MRNYQENSGLGRTVSDSDLEAMFAVTLKYLLLNCLGTLLVTKDKLVMPNSIALRALNLSCKALWKYLQGSRLLSGDRLGTM